MSVRLVLTDICKSYGGREVLRNFSYIFDKSASYALMGKNGTGKTTLLRICALLESPDRGTVQYFSKNRLLEQNIGLKRKITLVSAKVGVFNASVLKNVAYGLTVRGLRKKQAAEKIKNVLDFVGLADKSGQSALTLSSGEAQRMGIARAIAIDPEILFLDEPTASVDEEHTKYIEDIILKLKKEQKTAIVMATHDSAQAKRLSDEIILLK